MPQLCGAPVPPGAVPTGCPRSWAVPRGCRGSLRINTGQNTAPLFWMWHSWEGKGSRSCCAEPRGDTASSAGTGPAGTQPAVPLTPPGSPSNLGDNQDGRGNALLVPVELQTRCGWCAVTPQLCASSAPNRAVNKMKYEFY